MYVDEQHEGIRELAQRFPGGFYAFVRPQSKRQFVTTDPDTMRRRVETARESVANLARGFVTGSGAPERIPKEDAEVKHRDAKMWLDYFTSELEDWQDMCQTQVKRTAGKKAKVIDISQTDKVL